MKYTDTQITFSEFPDEISLCINISNCPWHCKGCHSPELWEDVGTELTEEELSRLIESNKGITLVGFMGGTENGDNKLAKFVKEKYPNLKVGVYTGHHSVVHFDLYNIDYIKIGQYIEEYGSLNNQNTNQKMFKINMKKDKYGTFPILENITYKFWKHGTKG